MPNPFSAARRGAPLLLGVLLLAASAGAAQAAGLKGGYAMCRDQRALTRLVDASGDGDAAAVGRYMRSQCRATSGSEKVRISARTATLAHIRVKGSRGSWWTVVEALR